MATNDDEYPKETVTYDDLTFTIQEWECSDKGQTAFLIEYEDDILEQAKIQPVRVLNCLSVVKPKEDLQPSVELQI